MVANGGMAILRNCWRRKQKREEYGKAFRHGGGPCLGRPNSTPPSAEPVLIGDHRMLSQADFTRDGFRFISRNALAVSTLHLPCTFLI